ncbi:hypothetical protein V5O48_009532 [Marasmius crinis-equi]|uniref:Antibiotic biosynthesis monooxygenase n=1 Tax=Marasmius crinis-equi TaxID=585013 RepID=A0ABR3FAZ3_9AGAR
MALLEIAVFKNSKGVSQEASEKLAGVKGLLSAHSGIQIEDPEYVHWVLHWETLDAHQKFAVSSEYREYQQNAGEMSSERILVEVTPEHDIPTVFGAPVSEFAIATLKSPSLREKWNKCLEVTLGGMEATKGAIAGVRGIAAGNPDQYVFVIGWESIEDHQAALAAPYAQDIYNETISLTHFNAKHARMSRLY